MCGIVCYSGKNAAKDVILEGLERLEYRGYDSAGLSVIEKGKLFTAKRSGKLSNLKLALLDHPLEANIGIGHIRWATHGAPTDLNAHPHLSNDKNIALVHNGIIENFHELKEKLIKEGYHFTSSTDTEVIAVLLEKYYEGDLLEAVKKVRKILKGSYALGIIAQSEPDRLVCVRCESPLVMGLAGGDVLVASDIPSILKYTNKLIYLENGDLLDVKDGYQIYDIDDNKVDREIKEVSWSLEAASKEGFDHFMEKEIFEQPRAIEDCLRNKLVDGKIDLGDASFTKEELRNFNKVYIVACGTASYAGNIGKYAIEKFAQIPVVNELASEFRYNNHFIDEKTLLILVSQSGETADTLAALREGKRKKATTLVVTNVLASSIDREADKSVYCLAGPEIAVASTKAYTTQVMSLYILALDFALKLKKITEKEVEEILKEVSKLPGKIQEILDNTDPIKEFANEIKDASSVFYIGRGLDYYSVIEGALKLKEVSYIHSEALAAGELKHGTLALIEEGSPVIAVATQENIMDKTFSNIEEVRARGAKVFTICGENAEKLENVSYKSYKLPQTIDSLYPILAVIPEQLLAYYTSGAKGLDVDKPRNLAKSVTVE
ncbi:MAG: glutamine--fructose-6-phosphate transaminase (isomerizing) [Peptoniphilaceae bacterium]|nr:glutamine--fructose-6-phosphate transaminase (isomerizing) [Peptoniphilaceae bacterium]MDY6019554.1 glutamine--fructose-6-phosphate transaminase (isomerizing) [Anaerococcus sp.]